MTAQRLSGECFDSTNFQENDRVNDKGEVKTKNNKFDKEAVGSSEVDAEATSYAAATNQVKGNEQVARIDVVGDEDGTVMTSRSAVDLKSSTPSSATYDPSEIAGAEGTVHTHPIKANELAPGKGDWQPAALGVPNYIAHGTRVVVVEISGGQIRVRVISGTLTQSDRTQIQGIVNVLQRPGRKY